MSGMFGGGTTNTYDDLVAKTTDENLTTENWELILNVCDKVQDDDEEGPRQLTASLLRRLSHRNPNVQLYTLSLADALSKNVGISVRRELGGRSFTQGLEKLITDRNTHDKVRKRALSLIAEWVAEWTEADDGDGAEAVGVMEDLYNTLKGKNYTFQTPSDPPPPAVDDEIRRKEEEELQRVLEMSVRDRGGWGSNGYGSSGFSGSSNGAGGSGGTGPATSTGFVPTQPGTSAGGTSTAATGSNTAGSGGHGLTRAGSTTSTTSSMTSGAISNRVRALHPFTPTEPGELGFNAGDVIIVVDRGYKDWWRGQLRGRTGIFPVNYVELLPPPDESQLAAEAIEEAKVFAEVGNVERLLEGLREVEREWGVYTRDQEQNATPPQRLSDNDSLQELYRSCMALRPKIVKLIEKYSQKRADLVSMNETFVRARGIFDRLMEESLASYGVGATGQPPYGAPYGPSPYGHPGGGPYQQGPGPGGYGQPGQAPYGFPTAGPAGAASPPLQGQPPIQGQGQGYPGPAATPGPGVYPQQPYPAVQGYPQQRQLQAQPYSQQQQVQPSPTPQQQPQPVQQQQQSQQPQPLQQQPLQQQPAQTSAQSSVQPSVQQSQPQPQRQLSTSVSTAQSPPPSTQPSQPETLHITGPPPYHYYPPSSGKTVTYADPNVQAWASYYAQGGTDLTGSVYFFSVPGIKEAEPGQPGSAQGSTAGTPSGQGSGDVSAGAGQSQAQGGIPGSAVGGVSTANNALTVEEPLSSSGTVSSGHTLENPYSPGYPESAAPNTASFSLYSPSYALPSANPGLGSVIGPGIGLTSMPSLSNPSRSSTVDSTGTLPYPGDLAGSVESLPYPGDAATINQPSNGSQTAPVGGPGFGLRKGPDSPGSPHSVHSFQQQQQQQQAPHQPLQQQFQAQSHGQYPYRVSLTDSGPAPSPSATSVVPSSTPTLSQNLNTSSSFSASPSQSHNQNSASFSSLPGVGAGGGPTGGSSPPTASSTPSWVLPKIGAGSGPGAGAAR